MVLAPIHNSSYGPSTYQELVQEDAGGIDHPQIQYGISTIEGAFFENRGQISDDEVILYCPGATMSVIFGESWVAYVLHGDDESMEDMTVVVKITFEGSNRVVPQGQSPRMQKVNYLIGKNREDWVQKTRTYCEVIYKDLYDSVDLMYELSAGRLKYTFTVHSGGDPSNICLSFEGCEGLSVEEPSGNLMIETTRSVIRDESPIAWQESASGRDFIETDWRISGVSRVGYSIGPYDRSRPLIIDPGLNFSTFIGSYLNDNGQQVCVDDDGFIYIVGRTDGIDFPTTPGVYCMTKEDFFISYTVVVKFLADGSDLIFSTYIEGENEWIKDATVDESGCVYLFGRTISDDYPTTPGVIKNTTNINGDLFLTKLSSDGGSLEFSSYLGGSDNEIAGGFRIDTAGDILLCGRTTSTDFPTTANALKTSKTGTDDGFLMKVNSDCSGILYSTLVGGGDYDMCYDLDLYDDDILLSGITKSLDFPTTPNAFDGTPDEDGDGFITIIDIKDWTIMYSSLFGGPSQDYFNSVHREADGTILGTGVTHGGLPITKTTYDRTYNGDGDVMVVRFNSNLSQMLWSTYFGADDYEWLSSTDFDDEGGVYLVGSSLSSNLPISEGAYDKKQDATIDVWFAKIDVRRSALDYCSYIGSNHSDRGRDIFVDDTKAIYVTGDTSVGFPTTPGAYSTVARSYEIFLLKIDDVDPPEIDLDSTPKSTTTGEMLMFNVSVSDEWGVSGLQLNYWYDDIPGSWTLNLTRTSGTSKNGTYSFPIQVPLTTSGLLNYGVRITDVNDLVFESQVFNVTVVDNDRPSVEDLSPTNATTGDGFAFKVVARDNIGMTGAYVKYWFGENLASCVNATMVHLTTLSDRNVTFGYDGLIIPSNLTGIIHYQFSINDSSGNWNSTYIASVPIIDDDRPVFGGDRSDTGTTTGEEVRFETAFYDNIGIWNVTLVYWFGSGEHRIVTLETWNVTGIGNGTYGTRLEVPSNASGTLYYTFRAVDTSGNVRDAPLFALAVTDNDLPVFMADLTKQRVVKGLEHTFAVEVADNVRVARVHLVFRIGDGPIINMTMDLAGDAIKPFEVPRDANGILVYWFSAVDVSGNWNSTEPVELPLVNEPPDVNGGIEWSLVEGVESMLDLGPYLEDPNDDLSNLTIECHADGIEVDGHILRARFDESNEPFAITITVSDGEDSNDFEVTVTIVDVNDPPVIKTELPSVLTLREDEHFVLALDGWDIENDALEWSTDSSFIHIDSNSGVISSTPLQENVGEHGVTITLMDSRGGESSVFLNVIVENVNDAPVISSLSPENGTRYGEGKKITFTVLATDEDGDDMTVTWLVDGKTLGTGTTLEYNKLKPGTRVVMVSVSDGTETAESDITLIIKRKDTGPGFETVLVCLAILGTAVILQRRFH